MSAHCPPFSPLARQNASDLGDCEQKNLSPIPERIGGTYRWCPLFPQFVALEALAMDGAAMVCRCSGPAWAPQVVQPSEGLLLEGRCLVLPPDRIGDVRWRQIFGTMKTC